MSELREIAVRGTTTVLLGSLKNHKLQEEYRKFIQTKVCRRHRYIVRQDLKRFQANEVLEMQVHAPESSQDERMHRIDKQENLLILFSKSPASFSVSITFNPVPLQESYAKAYNRPRAMTILLWKVRPYQRFSEVQ